MSLLAFLAALGQSTPSRPPAPPPAPPRRAEPRDYAFDCSLTGKDGKAEQIAGRFFDNNGALASTTITGNTKLSLPNAAASTLVVDMNSFWVNSTRNSVQYYWNFYLSSAFGGSDGYVTVHAVRSVSGGQPQSLGYLATGLCNFRTSESRMR